MPIGAGTAQLVPAYGLISDLRPLTSGPGHGINSVLRSGVSSHPPPGPDRQEQYRQAREEDQGRRIPLRQRDLRADRQFRGRLDLERVGIQVQQQRGSFGDPSISLATSPSVVSVSALYVSWSGSAIRAAGNGNVLRQAGLVDIADLARQVFNLLLAHVAGLRRLEAQFDGSRVLVLLLERFGRDDCRLPILPDAQLAGNLVAEIQEK